MKKNQKWANRKGKKAEGGGVGEFVKT